MCEKKLTLSSTLTRLQSFSFLKKLWNYLLIWLSGVPNTCSRWLSIISQHLLMLVVFSISRKPFVSRGSLTAASITNSWPACGMRSTRSRGSSMSSPSLSPFIFFSSHQLVFRHISYFPLSLFYHKLIIHVFLWKQTCAFCPPSSLFSETSVVTPSWSWSWLRCVLTLNAWRVRTAARVSAWRSSRKYSGALLFFFYTINIY